MKHEPMFEKPRFCTIEPGLLTDPEYLDGLDSSNISIEHGDIVSVYRVVMNAHAEGQYVDFEKGAYDALCLRMYTLIGVDDMADDFTEMRRRQGVDAAHRMLTIEGAEELGELISYTSVYGDRTSFGEGLQEEYERYYNPSTEWANRWDNWAAEPPRRTPFGTKVLLFVYGCVIIGLSAAVYMQR